MQLFTWLESSGLTQGAFGKTVGVTQGRIAQLLQGGLPSMALALRIEEVTGGQVTRNDWGTLDAYPSTSPQEGEGDRASEQERAAS